MQALSGPFSRPGHRRSGMVFSLSLLSGGAEGPRPPVRRWPKAEPIAPAVQKTHARSRTGQGIIEATRSPAVEGHNVSLATAHQPPGLYFAAVHIVSGHSCPLPLAWRMLAGGGPDRGVAGVRRRFSGCRAGMLFFSRRREKTSSRAAGRRRRERSAHQCPCRCFESIKWSQPTRPDPLKIEFWRSSKTQDRMPLGEACGRLFLAEPVP